MNASYVEDWAGAHMHNYLTTLAGHGIAAAVAATADDDDYS